MLSISLEIFLVCASLQNEERSDPGDYCPYILLPIMSKILPSFENDRISKYVEGTRLVSDLECGVRAFRYTADLLTVNASAILWMLAVKLG